MRGFVSVEVLLIALVLLGMFYPLAQGMVNSTKNVSKETVVLTYVRMSLSQIKMALYRSTILGTQYTVVTVPVNGIELSCNGSSVSMRWGSNEYFIQLPGFNVRCTTTTLSRGSSAIRVTPSSLEVIG